MLLSQLSLSVQQSLNFSILAMPARLWDQHYKLLLKYQHVQAARETSVHLQRSLMFLNLPVASAGDRLVLRHQLISNSQQLIEQAGLLSNGSA